MHLIVENLSQRYGDLVVFAGVTFVIGNGEAIVVTGTNGAGKSTLLRTLAGLTLPAHGSVRLEGGAADTSLAEQCHFVAALNAIKPELTARENLTQWSGVLGGGGAATVSDALSQLGLVRFADMPALVLSTGWRRRLALARLLVAERPLWLLDEPTAALDIGASRLVSNLIQEHLDAGGLAVIATHLDLGIANAKTLELSLTPSAAAP